MFERVVGERIPTQMLNQELTLVLTRCAQKVWIHKVLWKHFGVLGIWQSSRSVFPGIFSTGSYVPVARTSVWSQESRK